jgi:hypothetical protein
VLAIPLVSGHAQAAPTCTTTDTLTSGGVPSGNGTVQMSQIVPGFCVLALDKLYGDFHLGNLPGGTVAFQLTNVGGLEHHQVAWNLDYQIGNTYSFGYDVAVADFATSHLLIIGLDSDFTQTTGTSTLTKNTTPEGVPTTGISETKIGPDSNQPGNVLSIAYDPGVTDIAIDETLIDGGTVSSIINTVNELVLPTPEPATLTLLGMGVVGLAVFRRKRRTKQ